MALQDVLEQALRLSDDERAELADRLMASLDSETSFDPEHEAAWTAEIDRRVAEIRSGQARLVDGEAVFARVQAKLEQRRRER